MSGNGLYVGALVRSDPSLERPDLQMNISAWSTIDRTRDGIISHPFPAIAISPVHLRPEGRGTVRLKSPDPLAPPEIRFNFLRSDYDMQAIITGIGIARKVASQQALKGLVVEEVLPGPGVVTREQLADEVRLRGAIRIRWKLAWATAGRGGRSARRAMDRRLCGGRADCRQSLPAHQRAERAIGELASDTILKCETVYCSRPRKEKNGCSNGLTGIMSHRAARWVGPVGLITYSGAPGQADPAA